MNSHISSRYLLVLPKTSDSDLTLAASDVRDCSLPGLDLEGAQVRGGSSPVFMDLEPDRLFMRPISFNFQVDEKLENYLEILKMSLRLFKTSGASTFDCTIIPLTTLGEDFNLRFNFVNCRITSIDDLNYDNNASNKYTTCNITLKYEDLTITLDGEESVNLGAPV